MYGEDVRVSLWLQHHQGRFIILVKDSITFKGNLLVIACFSSARGQTLLVYMSVILDRDVYQLID